MDGMDCVTTRECLSARLDGEDEPAARADVDAHLSGCADCTAWYDDAAEVTRLVRIGLPVTSPGVDASVLAAAPGRGRTRLALALRGVLGVLGLAQFFLGITQINTFTGVDAGHVGGHLWHESAAWNVGIGAGFAWIALRRARPVGLIPTLTAFVVMLSLLSLNDFMSVRVDGDRLLSHAFLLVGYLILVLLTRPSLDFSDPPAGRADGGSRWRVRFEDPAEPAEPSRVPQPRALPGATAHREDREVA